MKKIFLLLAMALALVSCNAQLEEKVTASFPNGQPQIVQMLNKSV